VPSLVGGRFEFDREVERDVTWVPALISRVLNKKRKHREGKIRPKKDEPQSPWSFTGKQSDFPPEARVRRVDEKNRESKYS